MVEPPTILTQLSAALSEVPGLHIGGSHLEYHLPNTDHRYDARVDIHVGDHPIALWVEAKKSIYPRDVRQALWQIRAHSSAVKLDTDWEAVHILAADFISPGAKDMLRSELVGYFDSGGSLFLPARGAYLYIDKPPPKSHERTMRTLFSGLRAQVIHRLLIRPRTWFGVNEIAKEARVSPSTASEVLTQLDRSDWLETRGQGPGKLRQLNEPGALLNEWVRQQSVLRPPPGQRYYVSEFKGSTLPVHLGQILDSHQVTYAITAEAAAQRYAPFLTTVSVVRIRLMGGHAVDDALTNIGARVVTEGANVVLLRSKNPGELLFREQLDGIWLASPIQTYLDLLRGEGRSKELAEHLRRERIKF